MRVKGFSLIEIILALGILSVALLIVFAVFTPFLSRTGDVIEYGKVDRIANLITTEIQSLAYDEVISILNQEVPLFANRAGDTVVSDNDPELDERLPQADRYYVIRLIRNGDLSPIGKDDRAGYVAFQINIERLIRAPDGQLQKSQIDNNLAIFNTAVRRAGR